MISLRVLPILLVAGCAGAGASTPSAEAPSPADSLSIDRAQYPSTYRRHENPPVAVYPLTNIPAFDGPGARSDNATLLAAAGVSVIIVESETGGPRDLRFAAGYAVRNGLTWDAALRGVTLAPAAALGVADRFGSLEAGKVADIVIWSGDPFEFSTRPEHVFIEGSEVPLTSRQTELLNRYRTLPPSY